MPWQPAACLKVDMECCAQVVQASRHKSRQFFDKDYFFQLNKKLSCLMQLGRFDLFFSSLRG